MRSILAAAVASGFLVLAGITGASAEVVLRGASSLPGSHPLQKDFELFMQKLEANSGGDLKVNFLGGPELMPATEHGPALGKGLLDILFSGPNYYLGAFPEAEAFAGYTLPAKDIRAAGGAEIYDEALAKRLNSKFVAFAGGRAGLYMYTIKEPKLDADGFPNFEGMTFRTSPMYRAVFDEFKITSIVMPFAEIYTALERGMVDGLTWTLAGVRDSGWDRFLRYRIDPAIYSGSFILSMNLDKYNSLTDEQKAVLKATAIEFENELEALYVQREQDEAAELQKKGVATIKLSPEAATRFNKIAMEKLRERVAAEPKVELDLDKVWKAFYGQ